MQMWKYKETVNIGY